VRYYCETFDSSIAGYLEEECFSDAVFRHLYQPGRDFGPNDPLRDLFRESAQRSYFVLRRSPDTLNVYHQQLSFYRFDDDSLEVAHKIIDLKESEALFLKKEQSSLYRLVARTLFDGQKHFGDNFLLIRWIDSSFTEKILYDKQYNCFRTAAIKIAAQFDRKSSVRC
jgi:hypothetical protein